MNKKKKKHFQSEEQVDLQRKISEDPLMAIRQREMETRKKLLENPVKLKEIHRLLRTDGKLALKQKTAEAENVSKKSKKSKKSSKKSKKSKKKKKRHSRSSENDSSDASGAENEADLDAILAKKYKQLQGDEDGGSMDIDKLLKVKYNKLSEELDKMGGAHTKKKKKSKRNDVEKVKSDKTSAPTQVAPVRRHANPFSKKSATENDLPMLRVQGLYPAPSRRSPSPPKSRFNQSPPRPKRQLSRSPIRSTRKRSPPSRGSSRDHKRRSSSRDQFNRSKELKRRLSPSRKDRSRSRSLHKSSRRTASPANRRQSSALRGRQSPDRRQRSPLPRHRSPISSNKSAPNKEAATTSSYSGRKLTSQERRARSRSPHRSSNKSKQTKHRSTSSSASSKTPEATPDKFKTVSSKKPVTRSRSSASPSSSSSESTSATTDSEAEAAKRAVIASRNYGLVTAGGEKIAIKPTATSTTNRSDDAKKSTSSRKPLARHERPAKLSEEEKQKRLLEMQSNAEWRDTERRRNVSKYREEENREKAERAKETFDRDYINKELHKAMANQHSVESRLRANKNNIQRSSGAMDSNFAKR